MDIRCFGDDLTLGQSGLDENHQLQVWADGS